MNASPRTLAADDRLTVMGLLAETTTGLGARLLPQVAERGVSFVEFEVLLRLFRSPDGWLRMSDLAAQTSLTNSGVTRVVDRLVDRGLLGRRACDTDRRATFAVISDAGRDLLTAALPGHVALVEQWLTGPLREAGVLEEFTAALRLLRDHVVPCATAGARRGDRTAVPSVPA